LQNFSTWTIKSAAFLEKDIKNYFKKSGKIRSKNPVFLSSKNGPGADQKIHKTGADLIARNGPG